jgi:hypothetical protein
MTTPPDRPNPPDREPGGWAEPTPAEPGQSDPQSQDKPETPFDPYRYGAPEHPVPPEYAPPGYTPPPTPPSLTKSPTAAPPPYAPAQQAYGAQPGYGYQGGQQPYPTPPHYAQQYPQPKTGNGKAVAGLVLGILAIVFCWTSFFDVVLIALGVIFALLGLSESKRIGGAGRGMAIAGLVCALVGALFATLFTVFIYAKVIPCVRDFSPGAARDHCINQKFGG